MDRLLTPARAAGAVALLALAASVLPTIVAGIPVPEIADEFSYLLAADTFAHGRLTNPTHPFWRHFETFYVLQRPTYMSRYQPGQGLILALGQIAGSPLIGLCLSAALLAAATVWMLAAWVPVSWALWGGALVAIHPTLLSWSHSYWGGSVAAIGGALVVGAARRLCDRDSTRDSLILGLGIMILAESRPFEGAVFVACVAVAALALRMPLRRFAPAALVLAVGFSWMLYYNWRVTGRPLRLPYAEYDAQYSFTPPLFFQKLHPVALRQHTMWKLTVEWGGRDYYLQQHPLRGFLASLPKKLSGEVNGAFQIVPDMFSMRIPQPVVGLVLDGLNIAIEIALILPFCFFLPAVCRRDRCVRALALAFAVGATLALLPALLPQLHYAAPFLGAFVVLWIVALREMTERGFLRSPALVSIVTALLIVAAALELSEMHRRPIRWEEARYRAVLDARLQSLPGRYLVMMQYSPYHFEHFEWVQNLADIDSSKVVWAHSLPDSDAALLQYFRDRHVVLVIASNHEPLVLPLR